VILGGLSIIVIAFVINRKLQKDIDKMNRESRKTNVQFMRDTSERIKKEKEEKRKLKFED
jgi:ribosomal protein L18E